MSSHIQKSKLLRDTKANDSITFAAPGQGKYNILQSLTVESDKDAKVTIQANGKIIWQRTIQRGGVGYEKEWPEGGELRGNENADTVISVSDGKYTLNANGFVHP